MTSLTSLFNMGNDQRRRVSLFVMRMGLLPGDPISVVSVLGRDDGGRSYDLPVEFVSSLLGVVTLHKSSCDCLIT